MSSKDPKEKFKKFVGAESGGGRPKGKGYITELQRQKLKPAHLEVIVQKNKEREHYPKRVTEGLRREVGEGEAGAEAEAVRDQEGGRQEPG